MRRYLFLLILIFLALQSKTQTVVINEVCYSNKTSLFDHGGNSPDWFELYNSGTLPVNLSGYKMTDDTSKNEYYSLPEYLLDEGEHLIIFASNMDIIIGNEFHAGFRLENMKESLFLISPDGNIVDVIQPTCVPTDCSLSRQPDGSDNLSVTRPTPGSVNDNAQTVSVDFNVDTLMVSLNSGFYDAPVSVSLANLHPGNKIMYTLDGDDPDEESDVFNNPLYMEDLTPHKNRFANKVETTEEPGNAIFKANILRAVVYSGGCPASNEICNTYFINKSIKDRYGVPIVSLITDKDNLFDDEIGIYTFGNHRNFDQHGKEWEREVHIEIYDTTGTMITDQNAGMRIHGRGSRIIPQKSFRLYAGAEYGQEYFEYPYFHQKPDISRFKVLLLRTTGFNHGPLIKAELCNYLVQDMNMDYAASETAILFINGEYWGIYNLMERQNNYWVENNYQVITPEIDIIAYDREIIAEEGTVDEYNDLISWLQQANPESEGFYDEINSKIDIAGLVDYFIAELYLANTDWPISNIEMWKINSDTARWRYFFFDTDYCLEWLTHDHLFEYNNNIEDYQRYPEFSTLVLKTILKNRQFREQFIAMFYHHLATTFSTDRVIDEINRFEQKYAPMVPEHIYRWHDPVDYPKWNEHIAWLKRYAMQRPLIVAEQLQRNFGNPFTLFPNPCHGDFQVVLLRSVEKVTVKAYSLKGQLLNQWTVTNNPLFIKTGLPQGFYLLQIVAGGMIYYDKLIVQ
jgi:hypothetical protein